MKSLFFPLGLTPTCSFPGYFLRIYPLSSINLKYEEIQKYAFPFSMVLRALIHSDFMFAVSSSIRKCELDDIISLDFPPCSKSTNEHRENSGLFYFKRNNHNFEILYGLLPITSYPKTIAFKNTRDSNLGQGETSSIFLLFGLKM